MPARGRARAAIPARNYIFGPNGAGKTSLLEAVFVLGRGRSFRTRQMRRLVQHGTDGFAVFGEVRAEARLAASASRIGQGGSRRRSTASRPPGMAELAALLAGARDRPEHARAGRGRAERASAVPRLGSVPRGTWLPRRVEALPPRAGAAQCGARSAAPTARSSRPWSTALAEAGAPIDDSRRRYLDRLGPVGQRVRRSELLERPLDARLPARAGRPTSASRTRSRRPKRGIAERSTESGPHRADLVLRLDERRVQDEASRGQQKLTAAALILARSPSSAPNARGAACCVVDDPAAELDAGSLERLLAALASYRAQLVFTALTPAQLAPDAGFPVFHVERGEVRAL